MRKTELRDVLVFLPGIGGSLLEDGDGRAIWSPSVSVAWSFLTRPGKLLARLRLSGDDPHQEYLDDGVRAVGLVPDVHLIPGLWKIDGYSEFGAMVAETFEMEQGDVVQDDGTVANYFEFPYDWRRDNRATARRLQRFLEDRLARWRKNTPFHNGKLVIVAHSMGGLIARYFLDVLGGWRDCRALISVGTPYRGAVKACGFLANGHHLLFTDLTEVVRSLTSVYQLLPRYRMVEENGEFKRVTETANPIPGIDRERALDALRFHHEIEEAAAARDELGYELIPMVGTWQPTLQSAKLAEGKLTVDTAAPTWTEFPEGEGDGTVPRVSAVPLETGLAWLNSFVAERHASLQTNSRVLQDIQDRLILSQVRTDHIRGATAAAQRPALSLAVDDLYLADETVNLVADTRNIDADAVSGLRGRLIDAATRRPVRDFEFARSTGKWEFTLQSLPPGTYAVEVSAAVSRGAAPDAVHDVFAVAEP